MDSSQALASRCRHAVMALRACMALDALVFAAVTAWVRAPDGGPAERAAAAAFTLLSVVRVAAFGVCAVFFLRWLHLARASLDALGAGRLRNSPRWTVASWFVPLGCMVFPYEAAAEIWRTAALLSPPRAGMRRRGIGWWWATWLAYTLMLPIAARLDVAWMHLAAASLGVCAAQLAVLVARQITARERAAFALLAHERAAAHARRAAMRAPTPAPSREASFAAD